MKVAGKLRSCFPFPRGIGTVLLCLLLLLAGLISTGSAQNIQFTVMSGFSPNMEQGNVYFNGSAMSEYAGEIDITVTQFNGINVTPSQTVPTFCIELLQDIYLGTSYTSFTAIPLLSDTLFTSVSARDLTTLYYKYYLGNSSTNWNATTATAFQLDVWKIMMNPGNYDLTGTGGTFYVPSWAADPAALTMASSQLSVIGTATPVTDGGTSQPISLADPTVQDLLYTQYIDTHLVPFGVEAWPGAAVLGMIAILRVQRGLKKSARAP